MSQMKLSPWAGSMCVTPLASHCSRPDTCTALPRTMPPMAKNTTVQGNAWKSCLFNSPVLKKRTSGISATLPIPPKTCSETLFRHHKRIVVRVTTEMNNCFCNIEDCCKSAASLPAVAALPMLLRGMTRGEGPVIRKPKRKQSINQVPIIQVAQTGMLTLSHFGQSSDGSTDTPTTF